jgi:hypothetical protein
MKRYPRRLLARLTGYQSRNTGRTKIYVSRPSARSLLTAVSRFCFVFLSIFYWTHSSLRRTTSSSSSIRFQDFFFSYSIALDDSLTSSLDVFATIGRLLLGETHSTDPSLEKSTISRLSFAFILSSICTPFTLVVSMATSCKLIRIHVF